MKTTHLHFAALLSLGMLLPRSGFAIPADVTGDGALSVSDVQCVVLKALELTEGSTQPSLNCLAEATAADLDCSGDISVVDIQLMVRVVLGELVDGEGMPLNADPDQDNLHNECDLCPDIAWGTFPDFDSDGIADGCDDGNDDNFDSCALDCSTVNTKHPFEPSTETFINPERGFYRYTKAIPEPGEPFPYISEDLLSFYRNSEKISLIQRIYDLRNYRDVDLPAGLVEAMDADLAIVRNAGMKAIMRFQYYEEPNDYWGLEASPEQVLAHISQLSDLLSDNADIILTVQAGFIGAWGEWYYTHLFGDLGVFSTDDVANRKAVVDAVLAALPETRTIQLRTVAYKQTFYGDGHACFEDSPLARVGHHNDCFLASWSDYGTYQNLEEDYPYLHKDTECTPVGGETCTISVDDGGERSKCPTALHEMAYFHWTYINRAYHPDVLALWEEGGCFSVIEQSLGYRLHLNSISLPAYAAPGNAIPLSLSFENRGFAAPVNPRRIALILRHIQTADEWSVELNAEPRTWLPAGNGEAPIAHALNNLAKLPGAIPEGSYEVLVHLYDPEPLLANDGRFAIRIATQNVGFEADTGYNLLPINLEISSDFNGFSPDSNIPEFQAVP